MSVEPYVALQQGPQLKLDFESSFFYVDRAVEELLDFAQCQDIPVKRFELNLVMREALNNAVEHGNQNDASRRVRCHMWIESDGLRITVEDEGEGFDWRHDPLPGLDAMQDGGKGVLLMQAFGFDVSYNDQGNIVFLKKSFV